MSTDPQLQDRKRRIPLRELDLSWPEGQSKPGSWRETLLFMGAAVLEIAKALHRIADALDREEDTK